MEEDVFYEEEDKHFDGPRWAQLLLQIQSIRVTDRRRYGVIITQRTTNTTIIQTKIADATTPADDLDYVSVFSADEQGRSTSNAAHIDSLPYDEEYIVSVVTQDHITEPPYVFARTRHVFFPSSEMAWSSQEGGDDEDVTSCKTSVLQLGRDVKVRVLLDKVHRGVSVLSVIVSEHMETLWGKPRVGVEIEDPCNGMLLTKQSFEDGILLNDGVTTTFPHSVENVCYLPFEIVGLDTVVNSVKLNVIGVEESDDNGLNVIGVKKVEITTFVNNSTKVGRIVVAPNAVVFLKITMREFPEDDWVSRNYYFQRYAVIVQFLKVCWKDDDDVEFGAGDDATPRRFYLEYQRGHHDHSTRSSGTTNAHKAKPNPRRRGTSVVKFHEERAFIVTATYPPTSVKDNAHVARKGLHVALRRFPASLKEDNLVASVNLDLREFMHPNEVVDRRVKYEMTKEDESQRNNNRKVTLRTASTVDLDSMNTSVATGGGGGGGDSVASLYARVMTEPYGKFYNVTTVAEPRVPGDDPADTTCGSSDEEEYEEVF